MAGRGEEEDRSRSSGRLSLILGLVLAVLGAAGGYVLSAGMPAFGDGGASAEASDKVAFVALPPMLISLGAGTASRHLRFTAELEVTPGREAEVKAVMPRIADVLNGYLRAIDISVVESPTSLAQIRGQMLRRLQIITGDGMVRDLLVIEFVVS